MMKKIKSNKYYTLVYSYNKMTSSGFAKLILLRTEKIKMQKLNLAYYEWSLFT